MLTSPLPQTIFLCVWQAVHLNIPPPGEPAYKQIARRIGWSVFAIIAPEMVALNAWLQYRDARLLAKIINRQRGLIPERPTRTMSRRLLDYLRWLGNKCGMLCIIPVLLLDRLRMLLWHSSESRASEREQRQAMINDINSQLDKDQLPWTMDTAFYALGGGGVALVDQSITTLASWDFMAIAEQESRSLLPLQRAVLQDPSKASGLAKFITCAQAFWFCSQCIARLSQNMAISLLELNTFAHCISAFFIYVFWWHKPYDVATHVYIESTHRQPVPRRHTLDRSRNMNENMFVSFDIEWAGPVRPLIMILTFLLYGAIHSLAWQYQFPTHAEQTIWRCASIATASSGLIAMVTAIRNIMQDRERAVWPRNVWAKSTCILLLAIAYLFGFIAIAARSFLVVESFRALPNSPASIYEVPRWTAYIPHI